MHSHAGVKEDLRASGTGCPIFTGPHPAVVSRQERHWPGSAEAADGLADGVTEGVLDCVTECVVA